MSLTEKFAGWDAMTLIALGVVLGLVLAALINTAPLVFRRCKR